MAPMHQIDALHKSGLNALDLRPKWPPLRQQSSQSSGSVCSKHVRRVPHACIARPAWGARVRTSMFEARFQSFDDSSERAQSAARVAALRGELKRRGLDGFVVPRADRQQNEYLPASEERLAWLTGFTGSAGAAVVLRRPRGAVRRWPLHGAGATRRSTARSSRSSIWWSVRPSSGSSNNLKSGAKLGYDPWLHTSEQAEKTEEGLRRAGAELVAVDSNPIDALWRDRPAPPAGAVSLARTQARRRSRAGQAQAHPRRITRNCAPTRCWCPIRRMSPGLSTSVARMSRIRHWRLLLR